VGRVAYWQADLPAATRWYDAALEICTTMRQRDLESRRELARALYTGVHDSGGGPSRHRPRVPADLAATNGMPRVFLLMPFSVRSVFAYALDERDPFAAA